MIKELVKNCVVVTNSKLCERPFLEQCERAINLSPKALILREKELTEEEYYELALKVYALCKNSNVDFYLHKNYKLGPAINCKRIHLPLHILKAMSEEEKAFYEEIGVSTHSVDEAKEAVFCGATYITAGHIYETLCKENLAPRGLGFLKEVCENVDVPVYAIGGINFEEDKINEVMACGANGAMIMSAFMKC